MSCNSHLYACSCSLEPDHDGPHHCQDADEVFGGECGGMWLDHPRDSSLSYVVRYPVQQADANGVVQPDEPELIKNGRRPTAFITYKSEFGPFAGLEAGTIVTLGDA